MILVDTSVWIDHFRHGNARLSQLLEQGSVLGHPFVVGEIALGNLRRRASILGLLAQLPKAVEAENTEVLALIDVESLQGTGIGYVDAHLLASSRLTKAPLWTHDRCLSAAAARLGTALDKNPSARRGKNG